MEGSDFDGRRGAEINDFTIALEVLVKMFGIKDDEVPSWS
jgi:hypothetical protein